LPPAAEAKAPEKPIEGAPLALRTVAIVRSGSAGKPVFLGGNTGGSIARPRVNDTGALAIARGEAVERIENRDEGVEQSWDFNEAPRGSGDLVVRVRASGLRYSGLTEGGLHFRDPRTGLGFRYGHGTWIDARGRREAVPAVWRAGHIELRVPAALVDSSSYPATLDPTVSPEFGMDSPVYGPAWSDQREPAIAFGGGNFLVVWHDHRNNFSSTGIDVYGARVTPTGTVLDPTGILVSGAASSQEHPAIAFDGSNFLVVWHDLRNNLGYDQELWIGCVRKAAYPSG
jgi:hypothetical protein